MKRMVLPLLVCCLVFPGTLLAQTFTPSLLAAGLPAVPSPGQESEGGSLLSTMPLLKGLKVGKVLLNPSAQIGYQHIGTNLTIPASAAPRGPNELFVGPIDVALQNFNFWNGTVGLNVIAAPVTLFASLGGYLPGPFAMTGTIPVSDNTGTALPSITFRGSRLQFWTAQCGVGYTVCGGMSVLVGYIWSHTGADFDDPSEGSVPLLNQTLRGDVLLDIGIPFIGVQVLQEGHFRGAFTYSPLATSSGALSLQSSSPQLADLRYTLKQPGYFLGITTEYFFVSKPPVSFSGWFTGSYVNIRGTSDLEFTTAGPSVTREVDMTNTQYTLGAGLTLGLVF
jgi:hypothetical protein